MNVQITTESDAHLEANCIIIPFLPAEDTTSESISKKYSIPGLNTHIKSIEKTDGQFSLAVADGENKHDQVFLLWNCKSDSQAKANLQAIDFCTKNKSQLFGRVLIDLNHIRQMGSTILPALLRGVLLADYKIGKYKTENGDNGNNKIDDLIICDDSESIDTIESIINRSRSAANTIKSCIELVNEPANYKTPIHMAEWLKDSGKKNGFDVTILDKEELESLGFHALLAVNRGSEIPAKCLIGKYTGPQSNEHTPTIALVGKGVTFDTGGLSVKPSQNMHYMKSDMGGAAAVMGTIDLVSSLQLDINLVVVVPCTDNSVGSRAIKPGDVIGSYKGSTIEVIDTDAEGRLILADGIHYAIKSFDPDYLIDLATLTGSIVRTLGPHAAGLMSKSDFMQESLIEAGAKSGDRVWPLPLWDEYEKYMCSDVADIRNLSTKPVAGAITAGKFLEHFTDEHKHWAHLDIAGTAFGPSAFAKGYGASGFGILLLLSWIEIIIQKHAQ